MQAQLTDFFPSSPRSRSTTASPRNVGRITPKVKRARGNDSQYIIDAGQERFGLEYCSKCDMTFNANSLDDIKLHDEYHSGATSLKPFYIRDSQLKAWKQAHRGARVSTPLPGVIILVDETVKSTLRTKVEQLVKEHVDKELGLCEQAQVWRTGRRACIYIADALELAKRPHYVAGIALTETPTRVTVQPEARVLTGTFIGVNRLWVHPSTRQRGVAKTLMRGVQALTAVKDAAPMLVAFHDPVGIGQTLAISILGHKDKKYLTYDEDNLQ